MIETGILLRCLLSNASSNAFLFGCVQLADRNLMEKALKKSEDHHLEKVNSSDCFVVVFCLSKWWSVVPLPNPPNQHTHTHTHTHTQVHTYCITEGELQANNLLSTLLFFDTLFSASKVILHTLFQSFIWFKH